MTSILASLGFVVAAWLSFALVVSLFVALTWRALESRLRRWHPRVRAAIAFGAALAPSVLPTLLLLVCLAPGLAALVGWGGDHCLGHGDHPHLCLAHLTVTVEPPVMAALSIGILVLGLAFSRTLMQLNRSRRFLQALRPLTRRTQGEELAVVSSAQAFSFASRLPRADVWISSGLLETLGPEELEVVLRHERAHLRRGDPLRQALAWALSLPLWPGLRRTILGELALASERACDEIAGEGIGDRWRVAQTILAVERLAQTPVDAQPVGIHAFAGAHVAERVRGLLAEPPPEPSLQGASWTVAALAFGGLWLAAAPLHHATEHWLRLLLRTG